MISKEILIEYVKVLGYPKFNLPEDEINHLLYKEILPYTKTVQVKKKINLIKNDPSDNIFLGCALAGDADYIITGDKHLLSLGKYKGIQILSPAKFLLLIK